MPPQEATPGGPPAITRLSAVKVPALDGIRGIAVLLVLLHHLSNYLPRDSRPFSAAAAVLRTGWVGVDLFFVLSGFLITGILLDTKYAPNYFQSFYVRRVLRIFPLYYTVLSAILLAALLPYSGRWLDARLPLPHDRWFYFVYLNNWWLLLKDTWHGNIRGTVLSALAAFRLVAAAEKTALGCRLRNRDSRGNPVRSLLFLQPDSQHR